MKILVVEDEAPIRDLISINLQLVGYEVFSAEDGIIAQEFLEKQKVDLILLDVMLPGMDGFPFAVQCENKKMFQFYWFQPVGRTLIKFVD